jgi:(2Fe-2S) ferredoxin
MSCPEAPPLSPPAPRSAAILLGRSSLSASSRRELEQLRDRLRPLMPGVHLACASADRDGPGLHEALDDCLAACPDAAQILVQPLLLPTDPALLLWLEKAARRWHQARAGAPRDLRIVFAPALASLEGLARLLADNLDGARARPGVEQTVTGNWQHDPEAWSHPPPQDRHLLFCMGPRCVARGAALLWARLVDRLRSQPALKQQFMPLQTGCQYPCNLGPMMIVYPESTWFGHLDPAAIDQILDAALDPQRVDGRHLIRGPGPACDFCPGESR